MRCVCGSVRDSGWIDDDVMLKVTVKPCKMTEVEVMTNLLGGGGG